MRTFDIGVVGAGDISRTVHLPVLLNMPNARVAWVSDASAERARELAAAYGVRAVAARDPAELPPCDVALLAIPVDAREEYLRLLSGRGTAVLCEKPFAGTAAAHREYLGMFAPERLGCGFVRRFYHASRMLQQIVSARWLGPLRAIRCFEGGRTRGSGSGRSFLHAARGAAAARGVLMDLGSHGLDLAVGLAGATRFDIQASELVLDDGIDREARGRVSLVGAADGAVELEFCVSWLNDQENRLQLEFPTATVWTQTGPGADVFMGDPARPGEALRLEAATGGARTPNQAFYLEWQAFLSGVAHGQESTVSATRALLTTELVEQLRLRGEARR